MRQSVTRWARKASGWSCGLGLIWQTTTFIAGNERSGGAHGFEALVDPASRLPTTASDGRCRDPGKKSLADAFVALDSLSVCYVCVRHCTAFVSRVVSPTS